MKHFIIVFFLIHLSSVAQVQDPNFPNRNNGGLNNDGKRPLSNKDISIEGEKPPITDYLIISQRGDTTYLDTTLTIAKDYKFNYLRRDDFELLPFSNIGQPYNVLRKRYDFDIHAPRIGARARHISYLEVNDVYDYRVPTPLTELYFKTALNQGQQLDALFTTNLSPEFNFSISYKGVRSAGDYENTLSSTKIFKFTANYLSKNKKYRFKAHTTFHTLENEESAGITANSLAGFVSGDPNFDARARLDPNLDDATSILSGRRFYLDQEYELLGSQDSLKYTSTRIYNKLFYEDKFYQFTEATPTPLFLGTTLTSGSIADKANHEQGAIQAGLVFEHYLLGNYKAGISRLQYNYGYDRVFVQNSGTITNRLTGELYQLFANFDKRINKFDITAYGGLNVAGNGAGQFINAAASYALPDIDIQAGLNVSSQLPDFNYTLFQSDYLNYNWQNNYNNTKKQELFLKVTSSKYVDLDVTLTTLQDYLYFSENTVIDTTGAIIGFNATPQQESETLGHFVIKAHKELMLTSTIGIDNTLMFQKVTPGDGIINVPAFTTRNTVYYKNALFKKQLQLQTGFTLKYFTAYNMDGYDPVLGEFFVQNREEYGAFPLVDFFINARIRQTRIFFKVEHANAAIGDPTYFSAPRVPYRDLTIRFGLVWDFFL